MHLCTCTPPTVRHAVGKEACLEVMRRLPNATHPVERAAELRQLLATGTATAAAISDAGFSDGGEHRGVLTARLPA